MWKIAQGSIIASLLAGGFLIWNEASTANRFVQPELTTFIPEPKVDCNRFLFNEGEWSVPQAKEMPLSSLLSHFSVGDVFGLGTATSKILTPGPSDSFTLPSEAATYQVLPSVGKVDRDALLQAAWWSKVCSNYSESSDLPQAIHLDVARKNGTGKVLMLVAETEKHIFVVFPGTVDREDLWCNFKFTNMKGAHEGFLKAVENLPASVELFRNERNAKKPVIFCGHSKGGALAHIAHMKALQNGDQSVMSITFAPPLWSTSVLGQLLGSLNHSDFLSVVVKGDPVPSLLLPNTLEPQDWTSAGVNKLKDIAFGFYESAPYAPYGIYLVLDPSKSPPEVHLFDEYQLSEQATATIFEGSVRDDHGTLHERDGNIAPQNPGINERISYHLIAHHCLLLNNLFGQRVSSIEKDEGLSSPSPQYQPKLDQVILHRSETQESTVVVNGLNLNKKFLPEFTIPGWKQHEVNFIENNVVMLKVSPLRQTARVEPELHVSTIFGTASKQAKQIRSFDLGFSSSFAVGLMMLQQNPQMWRQTNLKVDSKALQCCSKITDFANLSNERLGTALLLLKDDVVISQLKYDAVSTAVRSALHYLWPTPALVESLGTSIINLVYRVFSANLTFGTEQSIGAIKFQAQVSFIAELFGSETWAEDSLIKTVEFVMTESQPVRSRLIENSESANDELAKFSKLSDLPGAYKEKLKTDLTTLAQISDVVHQVDKKIPIFILGPKHAGKSSLASHSLGLDQGQDKITNKLGQGTEKVIVRPWTDTFLVLNTPGVDETRPELEEDIDSLQKILQTAGSVRFILVASYEQLAHAFTKNFLLKFQDELKCGKAALVITKVELEEQFDFDNDLLRVLKIWGIPPKSILVADLSSQNPPARKNKILTPSQLEEKLLALFSFGAIEQPSEEMTL